MKHPQVKVPESIKNLRRESFQEHIYTKEPTKVTANLVSALGVMSQPEETKDEPCVSPTGIHRFDRIHDRLQSLVDVRISSELTEHPTVESTPSQPDTDAMTARGKHKVLNLQRLTFCNIRCVGKISKCFITI